MTASPVLSASGLSKMFGAARVTNGVDFALHPGDRRALIGPNGAGKTTLVNLLSGRLAPTSGTIRLGGADVTALSERARIKRGVGRTFQITSLFPGLTVRQNVTLAVAEHEGIGGAVFRPLFARRAVAERVEELLGRLRLGADADATVSRMPYGKQRLVEIAMALALKPSVLLLDEPAAGIPSGESGIILDLIDRLPRHIAVLLIDHDMELVFRFATAITVLVQGAVFREGTPAAIKADPAVRSVYLGEESHG